MRETGISDNHVPHVSLPVSYTHLDVYKRQILGVTAMLFPIATSRENIRRDAPFCFGVSVLLVLLAFDFFTKGETLISGIDGVVLLAIFAFFLWITLRKESQDLPVDTQVQPSNGKPLWYSVTVAILGLSVLILGCHFFVEKAVVVARNFCLLYTSRCV